MKKKIIIVDDEKSQLETVKIMVSNIGYQPIIFDNAKSAQLYLRDNFSFSDQWLVITDLVMPKVDGFSLIKKLKPEFPTVPVIVLTSQGDIKSAVNAMQLGADDFLVKPIEPTRLKVSLSNALRLNRMDYEVAKLDDEHSGHATFDNVIGKSSAIVQAVQLGGKAAL